MSNLTRILSIDGGGIRGIIPGQILVEFEKKLKKYSGNDDARIADYFDLIAGTSTGGILACIYLFPGDGNPLKPKFSAKEAVNLYLERGDEIFDVSLWQKIRSAGGLTDEKYSANELEEALALSFTPQWLTVTFYQQYIDPMYHFLEIIRRTKQEKDLLKIVLNLQGISTRNGINIRTFFAFLNDHHPDFMNLIEGILKRKLSGMN
ncbi:patatin-like phospholipase family protein [Caldithrix abyssi]|nr:patatin-like phospholipase family protein [Caldithrix abyssi]